jgi:hypothetical protein
MSRHPCCQGMSEELASQTRDEQPLPSVRSTAFGRMIATIKWATPTVILLLLPKCPMCVAAYIAFGTGLGISMPVATWIRGGLIAACATSFAWLAITTLRRRLLQKRRRVELA